MKKICTEVSCEYFIPYKHCKAEKCVKKQTNADKIRSMTDDELVNFFWNWCDGVECKGKDCNECIEIWLKQEATE